MRLGIDPSWPRDVFIETGTFEGESLATAANHFAVCHSIEVSQVLADAVRERFKDRPHVHVHQGSSPMILPLIIDPRRATVFWLDAHYQGLGRDQMDAAAGECPLLAELDVILAAGWEVRPVILIDDAHCFGCPGNRPPDPKLDLKTWPTYAQIAARLAGWALAVRDDVIVAR